MAEFNHLNMAKHLNHELFYKFGVPPTVGDTEVALDMFKEAIMTSDYDVIANFYEKALKAEKRRRGLL